MKKHLLVIAVAACFATAGIAQAAPTSSVQPVQNHPTGVSAQLSAAQRSALVAQIVRAWGPFVQQVHQTSAAAWAGRMQGTFAAATDSNLQRAAGMKTFQGMMDALVGQHLTDAQVTDSLATQALVLKSGVRPALLGSTTADLVYTPVAPCRIADTRNVGGPIASGFSRNFRGYTAGNFAFQGGIATSNCGIPANPSALMLNVAAPVSSVGGYLTVWPFGTARPFASNLDYKAGDLANNEMAAKMTIGSPTAEFSVYANGTTNVVVDVVGYFMAPVATPVDCTRVHDGSVVVAPGLQGSVFVYCPNGRHVTGGGCGGNNFNVNWSTQAYAANGDNAWFCAATNTSISTNYNLQADAVCCTVPGR